MIYMVEHTFSIPAMEADWNAWYAGNVEVLLSVPGIHTAQRFQVPGASPPRYMAMYTVASGDVFESAAYKQAGGGGTNSQRFRAAYQVWTRNLLDHPAGAPSVPRDRILLQADRGAPGGGPFEWFSVVGLHKTTVCRGLAVLPRAEAEHIAGASPDEHVLYAPITDLHPAPAGRT